MHYDFDDFCKLITLADWEFEFEMNFSKLGDFYQCWWCMRSIRIWKFVLIKFFKLLILAQGTGIKPGHDRISLCSRRSSVIAASGWIPRTPAPTRAPRSRWRRWRGWSGRTPSGSCRGWTGWRLLRSSTWRRPGWVAGCELRRRFLTFPLSYRTSLWGNAVRATVPPCQWSSATSTASWWTTSSSRRGQGGCLWRAPAWSSTLCCPWCITTCPRWTVCPWSWPSPPSSATPTPGSASPLWLSWAEVR